MYMKLKEKKKKNISTQQRFTFCIAVLTESPNANKTNPTRRQCNTLFGITGYKDFLRG